MLGFVKIKSFSQKMAARVQVVAFSQIKAFADYANYSAQLKQSRQHVESVVRSSRQMAHSMDQLRKEKNHLSEAAKLSGLVILTRAVSSARAHLLKYTRLELFDFAETVHEEEIKKKQSARLISGLMLKIEEKSLIRGFWKWTHYAQDYRSQLTTKSTYMAKFLLGLFRRDRSKSLSKGFWDIVSYTFSVQQKHKIILRLNRLYR